MNGDAAHVRVMRVIARLNMGGPALHVSYLTKGLETRGYETTLVVGSIGRGEGSMEHVLRDVGVEPVVLRRLQREIAPVADVISVLHLRNLIQRHAPHILHTHTAKAGALARAAAVIAGRARPPIVVHTFHGHVLKGYFSPAKTSLFRAVERNLARVSDALVAVSPEVRDELVGLGVADREKFAVVRLGIDLDDRLATQERADELRRLFGLRPETFVIGWVGRMTQIKRGEDVVEITARVRARGVDATLLMLGDGPDRIRIETRARKLGISRSTLFVGYQDEVAPYYGLFDALLLPSANEGTPVSAIESLSSGTPVVASHVGGVSDVVRDGIDGFLFPPADLDAAADRLALLATDADLRRRMGASGRENVTTRYAVGRLLDDVDALYRRLLAAKGVPQPAGYGRATSASSSR